MKYYKVKVIKQTAPNSYHVICTEKNITLRMFPALELALAEMRDLNAEERKKAKDAAK